MTPCRYTDLRCKEVINVCDGCRLGFVCDVEVELPDGRVCALWVPGPWRWQGLFSRGCCRIPWPQIRRIGGDMILVEADLDACRVRPPRRRRRQPLP